MSSWLVTGASGLLGADLVDVLRAAGHEVTGLCRADLDIRDVSAVRDAVAGHAVVVNCAAWTAVDEAEDHEEDAWAVNAVGAGNVAGAAAAHGARVVHVSTDYVFDGTGSTPYAEGAPTHPTSAYGRTKAEGERRVRVVAPDHLVVRTAWLYGARGSCFPRTLAHLLAERDEVEVVDDQRGQPTWTRDVSHQIERLVVARAPSGTYHATSSGETTWFGFAREIARAAGYDPRRVVATVTEDFPRPARRPAYSVLGHAAANRLGIESIGRWDERWHSAAPVVLEGASPERDLSSA